MIHRVKRGLHIERQALLWLRVPLALAIATVVLAASMVSQAWAGEYVYKLHLTVKGTEEVSINNGPEPSSLPSSVTQTAEWTWSPLRMSTW